MPHVFFQELKSRAESLKHSNPHLQHFNFLVTAVVLIKNLFIFWRWELPENSRLMSPTGMRVFDRKLLLDALVVMEACPLYSQRTHLSSDHNRG